MLVLLGDHHLVAELVVDAAGFLRPGPGGGGGCLGSPLGGGGGGLGPRALGGEGAKVAELLLGRCRGGSGAPLGSRGGAPLLHRSRAPLRNGSGAPLGRLLGLELLGLELLLGWLLLLLVDLVGLVGWVGCCLLGDQSCLTLLRAELLLLDGNLLLLHGQVDLVRLLLGKTLSGSRRALLLLLGNKLLLLLRDESLLLLGSKLLLLLGNESLLLRRSNSLLLLRGDPLLRGLELLQLLLCEAGLLGSRGEPLRLAKLLDGDAGAVLVDELTDDLPLCAWHTEGCLPGLPEHPELAGLQLLGRGRLDGLLATRQGHERGQGCDPHGHYSTRGGQGWMPPLYSQHWHN